MQRAVVDLNGMVASISDDIGSAYDIGDGSDICKMPVQIQTLARPMAMLRMVKRYQEAETGIPLFVKTHMPHVVANGIELLPESLTKAVIHIVRDPRDVLPSYAKHMGVDLDIGLEWMADNYRHLSSNDRRIGELISSWDMHARSYLEADTHNVRTWRYEDMIEDPVKAFAEMLEHSGVEPDLDRVAKAVEAVSLSRLREKEKAAGFRESSPHAKDQFFGKGGSNSRSKLEVRHKKGIRRHFGRVMERLGYVRKHKVAA